MTNEEEEVLLNLVQQIRDLETQVAEQETKIQELETYSEIFNKRIHNLAHLVQVMQNKIDNPLGIPRPGGFQ